jgi:cysteine sulfinate desulfinase/cysteine desulfurase-like protein
MLGCAFDSLAGWADSSSDTRPVGRFGLGRFTTAEEVDRAVALTVAHVEKLRQMSPLWEMVQEGIDIKSIQWSQH